MLLSEFVEYAGVSRSTANWIYMLLNPDTPKGTRKKFTQRELDWVLARKVENFKGNIKPVNGYGGKYFVSDTGKVYNNRCGFLEEMEGTVEDGQVYLRLVFNGTVRRVSRCSLVADAFLPNPPPNKEVTHRTINRLDDSVANLAWWR